jgi:hypothetical protein
LVNETEICPVFLFREIIHRFPEFTHVNNLPGFSNTKDLIFMGVYPWRKHSDRKREHHKNTGGDEKLSEI